MQSDLREVKRAAARLLLAVTTAASCSAAAAAELGVFRGNAPDGPPAIDAYNLWLGKSVQVGSAFEAQVTWTNIAGESWNLKPWSDWVRAQPGRNIALAVPMLPASGASLASCAAGQYDTYWAALANNLAYYGLHWAYLRLGWEMDGTWFAWNAAQGSGKEASFAGCFRRVVQVMRQTQPANQWKFVLNPSNGFSSKSYLDAVWPGDAYVDVVALDYYDQSWAPNTYPYPSTCDATCRATHQQNAWNDYSWRLYAVRDFAIAHGKQVAFPEWGTGTRPDGHGGGDNPGFIQKMYNFIQDPANNVAFHLYWDYPAQDFNCQLSGATNFPQAAALYKQLFGATSSSTNTAPTVSITSPSAGQTVAGTLAYAANATDNAGVSRVDFFVDSTALLSDTSSPYGGSLDTTKLANGTHVLKAVAYDAQGLSATSQVSVNVQNIVNTAPTVAITSPTAGQTVSGTLSYAASATDNAGVSRVDFFVDSTALLSDATSPYGGSLDTTKFANGTHALKAVAYDAQGLSATSQVSINVQNSGTLPTVSFSSPAAGATVSGSPYCEVTGTGISRVVFFMDSTQLNTENYAPWNCVVDTRLFANGTHTLKAVAYNSAGGTTTATSSVNVQNGGPSGVTFKAPIAGATISGTIGSSACEVTGSGISRVVFFMDSTQLNTENYSPWNCAVDTRLFANGSHTLKAVAYDSTGAYTVVTEAIKVQN